MFLASFFSNIAHFFIQGGFFMFLLVLLSIAAVAVMILRGRALREKNVLTPEIRDEIERLAPGDSLLPLQQMASANPSALGKVVMVVLKHLTWPRSETIEAVQTRARHEIAHMERGLVILEISTGVAPLLGLLGTLSGLVSIFASIGTDPVAVARGIAEALNTTIAGLGVAAPCLVAHNYFQRRIEVMSVEMESLVSDLIAKCYPQHTAAAPVETVAVISEDV